jgi:hypothetical protein
MIKNIIIDNLDYFFMMIFNFLSNNQVNSFFFLFLIFSFFLILSLILLLRSIWIFLFDKWLVRNILNLIHNNIIISFLFSVNYLSLIFFMFISRMQIIT